MMRLSLVLFLALILTACDYKPTEASKPTPASKTESPSISTEIETLKKENIRLKETLDHTTNDAIIAEGLKNLQTEKKAFEEKVVAFKAEKKAFEETRHDALLALDKQKDLEKRETALITRNLELDKQHAGIIFGAATLSILSMLLFYFIMTTFLGKKIAAIVAGQLMVASLAVEKKDDII